MNMIQLNYFIKVCDEGSISRAAQKLFISKQGLSRSIQNLEDELGTPLLIRTLSGIQLTGSGHAVYQYAKQILGNYHAMLRALEHEDRPRTRKLRIAFSHGFFACVPTDLLLSFFSQNPEIICEQYSFKDMDLREKFISKNIDLALCSGPRDNDAFEYITLFSNFRCLYVNSDHRFAQRKTISVQDLKGELIGVPGEGYFDSPFILEQCRKYGFEPRLFLMEGLDLLTQFAQAGRGVSLIVDNIAQGCTPKGLHTVYFDDKDTFTYEVYILIKKGNRTPEIQAFIQHAQEYCRRLEAVKDLTLN